MYKIGKYEFNTKEDCINFFGIGRTRFYHYLLQNMDEKELISILEEEKGITEKGKISFKDIPLNWEQILYAHIMGLVENLADKQIQKRIESQCIIGNLRKAIDAELSDRQQKILIQRFDEDLVFADIIKGINISASRAHQLISEAIGTLKASRQKYMFSLPDMEQTICNLEKENDVLRQNLQRYDDITSSEHTEESNKHELLIAKLQNQSDMLSLDIKSKTKTITALNQEIDLRQKTISKQKQKINKFNTPLSNMPQKLESTNHAKSGKTPKDNGEKIKTKEIKEELGLDRSNLILFAQVHHVTADDKRCYTKEQAEWMRDIVKRKKHYISHSLVKIQLGKPVCDSLIESGALTLPVDQELVTNHGSLVKRFMTIAHFEDVQKTLAQLKKF